MDHLTNLAWGALGALAVLLGATLRPFSRVVTGLRTATRRVLGLEHFETMVLDELREQVQRTTREDERLDRHISDTRRIIDRVGERLEYSIEGQRARNTRVNNLKREVEELGILLRQYTTALGPMWTTAQGHQMPLRLLSTPHLKNIIDGHFVTDNSDAGRFIRSELERRRIDTDWRVRQSKGEKPPTKGDYIAGRVTGDGQLMPPVLSISPETRARLYVLPDWARSIIEDLRTRRVSRVSKQNRERIERVLPLWARELIDDLLRRAKR